MNFGKRLRSGNFFSAYREEESAFKCTFDVGLDEEDDGDAELIDGGLMQVESEHLEDDEDDEDEDDDDDEGEEEISNQLEDEIGTEQEMVTKKDMEEMIRLLRQESIKDKEKLFNLEDEIRKVKRRSIFQRKEILKRQVLQVRFKLDRYQKQNALLKGLAFKRMSKNYEQNFEKELNNMINSINQDGEKLSSIAIRRGLNAEIEMKDDTKSVQTLLSDVSNRNRSKDGLIESQYRLNQRLRQKLNDERQRRKLDPSEPNKMMVTLEEHRDLIDKLGEIELILTKSIDSFKPSEVNVTIAGKDNQSSGNSSPSTSTNEDSKVPEKFYVCKCGQKFVKVDKRMRKMDKNYTGISATTAYSIYRNHFSQCPVYLKDAIMCDVCQDVFYSIPCLKVHIRSKHPDCVDLLEKYKHKYVCLCGRSFKNYSQECTALKALRKHAVSCPVYRSQAILCEICGVPFLEENHLENHIRMAHKDYYSSKKLSSPIPCSSSSSVP